MPKSVLTPEKESYIIAHYLQQPSKAIAKTLSIDKGVVLRFLKANNLKVPAELLKNWQFQHLAKPYTPEQKEYIIANIKTKSIKQIATELGRSSTTLQKEVHKMGLTEIIEYKKRDSYLKAGHTPPNKGKKQVDYMSPEAIEKTKATRFKKGQLPHNTLPIGTETQRLDKSGRIYTMVKVKENRKLTLKQREVWKTHNGNIPPKHKIIFKDGNTQNFNIENLECVTYAEAMKRNSLQNLPKEITELIYLKAAITRQINKHKTA